MRYRAVTCGDGDLVLACALITATVDDGLGAFDHLQQPLTANVTHDAYSFRAIANELARPTAGIKSMIQALMTQILLHTLRNQLADGGVVARALVPLANSQLRPALLAMASRPQERHCLDGLARIAGMSRSRFTHRFNETYGTSPMNYLHVVRLRAAARLLQDTDTPVKAIAGAVGFESRSYFSRAFSARFGMAPARFRDIHRDTVRPASISEQTPALNERIHPHLAVRPTGADIAAGGGLRTAEAR